MKSTHKWQESNYEKMRFSPGNDTPAAPVRLKLVTFYLVAPAARAVGVAGDFNHWQPLSMQPLDGGWWVVQTHLRHGFHQYRFVVDGKPVLDSHAPGVGRNEWRELVSVIEVY
jgi:1,4-alpha-glucan branching enzyme